MYIQIHLNKIENRIKFRIKKGFCFAFLTS